MSVVASAQETSGRSDNAEEYRRQLISHAHTIVHLGYGRLNGSDLVGWEEEDITGALAEAMNAVLACPETPSWRTFYAVHEEPRVWNQRRRGKRRMRLDIQVEYTGGVRPRFSFEAKRLRISDTRSISKYLGREGLLCFVLGHYASESNEAGMLAYIQSNDLVHWAAAIEDGLKKRRKNCEWIADEGWVPVELAKDLESTFKTMHARSAIKKSLVIYHTLLLFVPAQAD